MGVIISKITRPIRNFNVENRALKVISREKPVPAPHYKQTEAELQRVLKENPNMVEELSRKNQGLDNRLKDVYVSSLDIVLEPPKIVNPNKPLPLDRKPVEDFEYGFKEPQVITKGYTTLRHALKFITDHQAEPNKYTSSYIAATYNLKEETVRDILYYYSSFEVFVPDHLKKKLKDEKGIDLKEIDIKKEEHRQLS